MKRLTKQLSVIAVAFSGILSQATVKASNERWFEIEIIVYKSTSSRGLYEESWDKNAQFKLPDNYVDFLQPYEDKVSAEPSNLKSDELNTAESPVTENKLENQVTSSFADANDALLDKAFKRLSENQLQLKNESNSLKRHPEYQVLAHYAWRQPVYDAKNAQNIRIAGGQDFSESYKFDGNKIIHEKSNLNSLNSSFQNAQNETHNILNNSHNESEYDFSNENAHQDRGLATDQLALPQNSDNLKENTLNTTANENPEKIALPWVPELDGVINIYVNRYLHVKTDLFLRRPDKEAVEVIDLSILHENPDADDSQSLGFNQTQPLNSNDFSQKNPLDEQPTSSESNKNTPQKQSQINQLLQANNSQFTWEIDENFLQTETEKMYIERLFNYPLTQSRRLRSGELHYFDHPLLGVLILITPYDIETGKAAPAR